ncbi:bifunctional 2-polyprenyl-6-hydroxyphenol methylase/3-demethylubiquinol 3-O-methyltransferase UbiG [Glaciecola sp. KUL10]|uniref:class I SAM-dependent methyltransferase n=1 Tax=Glaciecola sp. (strain KUL10) TaxID=2161813 RepID=UPI000D863AFD|nr:class I SAM-dependent methyltransferase [Glaciecola sp. KUL10]GBL04182.1 hypothetical protein KUL10_14880 [Glaciecola sp. KUL10]
MKIKTISENWQVTQSSYDALKAISQQIHPKDPEIVDWYKKYANSQRKRLSYDIDYTEKFCEQGDKILEFGSAPFLLTTVLKNKGYEVTGLDLKPGRFAGSIHKHKLDVKRIDFETQALPFENNTFDAAIFNEVFEHLRINPIFTLRQVHRVLKPGGKIMLSTPNLMSWKGWYNFVFKNKLPCNLFNEYRKLELIGHMGHIRLYSTNEVITFLSHIGFDTEVIIYRGEWQSDSESKRTWGNRFLKLFPKYRTFFSVVAKKR